MNEPLPPFPQSGRVFQSERRIRLSDMAATGRLRLDAVARYLQDVATDDVEDTGTDDSEHVWLVRRTVLDVLQPWTDDGAVTLMTWPSGVGPRWATRRSSVRGNRGGHIEAESLWVHLHRDSLQPQPIPARFRALYRADTLPRVSGKLLLPADVPEGTARLPWPVRVSDIDIMGHVNNAAYWEAIEAVLPPDLTTFRAVLEYRQPIDLDSRVVIATSRTGNELGVWFVTRGEAAAVAVLIGR